MWSEPDITFAMDELLCTDPILTTDLITLIKCTTTWRLLGTINVLLQKLRMSLFIPDLSIIISQLILIKRKRATLQKILLIQYANDLLHQWVWVSGKEKSMTLTCLVSKEPVFMLQFFKAIWGSPKFYRATLRDRENSYQIAHWKKNWWR